MPVGALTPIFRWLITNNGVFSPGAKLYTYVSGTSFPRAVYTDIGLTIAHANPVVADNEGVLPAIYLLPQSYRMEVTDADGAVIFPAQDNIYDFASFWAERGTPSTVLAVYGTTITAGQSVYISDGSGGNVAGRWYLTDADLTYASSNAPITGIALTSGAAGASGLVVVAGRVTNVAGLGAGLIYYASATEGTLTSTPPANARVIGITDSSAALILSNVLPGASVPVDNAVCDGRLTLTTGVPVTTGDVTAAGTLYFAPYMGNRVALHDGSSWSQFVFTQVSLALTITSGLPYDVFLYNNGGTLTLELTAWTNATTRATALATQDGVLVRTGATTRRYLGTIAASASNQTEDSAANRLVWNYYNRVDRSLLRLEGTNTWTYDSPTWRQANAAAANKVRAMIGVAEDAIDLHVGAEVTYVDAARVAIGLDSTTTPHTSCVRGSFGATAAGSRGQAIASLRIIPAEGVHDFNWLEEVTTSATATFYGDDGGTLVQSGITGICRA